MQNSLRQRGNLNKESQAFLIKIGMKIDVQIKDTFQVDPLGFIPLPLPKGMLERV